MNRRQTLKALLFAPFVGLLKPKEAKSQEPMPPGYTEIFRPEPGDRIVSCLQHKDRLIVACERSIWQVTYNGLDDEFLAYKSAHVWSGKVKNDRSSTK